MAFDELYIAEKPDVGRVLADFIGRKKGIPVKKLQGAFEIGNVAVTYCVGHMMESAPPDHYLLPSVPASMISNGKVRWSLAHLPIVPNPFVLLEYSEASKKAQLRTIESLMKQSATIFHCADKDREGQSIVDELIEHFKMKHKPIKRIAFSALDDFSIDAAFKDVCDNNDPRYKNMGAASIARREGDWMIGMNLTRALSICFGEPGKPLTVGRVQTPVLAIVVRRYWDIKNFKPVDFFKVQIQLPDGTELSWRKRRGEAHAGIDSEGRIIDRRLAESIVESVNRGLKGEVVRADVKEKSTPPPLPYSLTSLQKEMSARHGLTVDETQAAAQSLYEKKMQTYVGTDSRYLPESMHADSGRVIKGLHAQGFKAAAEGADLDKHYACWNTKEAEPHHAIIPTGNVGSFSNEAERLVFGVVTSRFIAQFYPEYRYSETNLEVDFGQDVFAAVSKTPIAQGWKLVDSDSADKEIHANPGDDLELTMEHKNSIR